MPLRAPDTRRILAAQAVRALAYGFGSVLLGASLDARGWSGARIGMLLTAIVAGTALMSFIVGTLGDRIGRRRFYASLFVGLAVAGATLAFAGQLWILLVVALTGTLSVDVVESGPFTSLEQAMLPSGVKGSSTRVFGIYNAIAAFAGSGGALLAGGPALLRRALHTTPADQRFFLLFVPAGIAGALLAMSLSDGVEPGRGPTSAKRVPLTRSRANVTKLAGLFAADSFGGGFIIQSFIAYWFHKHFGASLGTLGVVFFGVGMLQTASFLLAVPIARRFGLLNTMVFTHLPSNVLLACIPLAPNLGVAIALLLARQMLSQMDVPTRQAYIAELVDSHERTAAAAYTNTARYLTRPLGPALAGAAQSVAAGMPFFLAGGIKAVYDLVLYSWFRRVPLARAGEDATREPP